MVKRFNKVLVLSDLHFPYAHKDTFPYIKALIKKYRPEAFVIMGDELDYHSLSFHDSDPDLDSSGKELSKALGYMETLYKILGKKPVFVLESNHGSMYYRKAKHHGMPRHLLKSYQEVLNAPKNWSWHPNLTLKLGGDDVLFVHGMRKNALAESQKSRCNYVQSHHHSTSEIRYWSDMNDNYFYGVTVGCMIDDQSYAFAYNKLSSSRPILSHLLIDDGTPKLLPMKLNKNKRWSGKLP